MCDFRIGHFEEVKVILERELFIGVLVSILGEVGLQTLAVEMEVEPKLGHDALHLVLVLLVLICTI